MLSRLHNAANNVCISLASACIAPCHLIAICQLNINVSPSDAIAAKRPAFSKSRCLCRLLTSQHTLESYGAYAIRICERHCAKYDPQTNRPAVSFQLYFSRLCAQVTCCLTCLSAAEWDSRNAAAHQACHWGASNADPGGPSAPCHLCTPVT